MCTWYVPPRSVNVQKHQPLMKPKWSERFAVQLRWLRRFVYGLRVKVDEGGRKAVKRKQHVTHLRFWGSIYANMHKHWAILQNNKQDSLIQLWAVSMNYCKMYASRTLDWPNKNSVMFLIVGKSTDTICLCIHPHIDDHTRLGQSSSSFSALTPKSLPLTTKTLFCDHKQ